MERISIFNYEAFYLDYLEGNLSVEDTRMLMEFFETHPECRLEIEEVVTLDKVGEFSFLNKESLKQVDEEDAISLDNIEYFMIADAEGILDRKKSEELHEVIDSNEKLLATKNRYDAVYFEADESLIYKNKKSLKRRTIVLWPYLSVASAAAVIALVFFVNAPQVKFPDVNFAVNNWVQNISDNQSQNSNNEIPEVVPTVEVVATNNPNSKRSVTNSGKIYNKQDSNISDIISSGPLKSKPIPSLTSFDTKELMPVSTIDPQSVASNHSVVAPVEERIARNDAMNNPIEPITNFLSDKVNREVDFGQRKPKGSKKRGFYVKVGKFELSRNRH